jgi:hypothetical protein
MKIYLAIWFAIANVIQIASANTAIDNDTDPSIQSFPQANSGANLTQTRHSIQLKRLSINENGRNYLFKRGLNDVDRAPDTDIDMGFYDPNKANGLLGAFLAPFKALGQAIEGDNEGAEEVMDKFTQEIPIMSQVRSFVEAAMGNLEAAKHTQEHFLENTKVAGMELLENTPIVGHITGAVYYATGNTEGGDRAMEGATKTLVIAVAGVTTGGAGGNYSYY